MTSGFINGDRHVHTTSQHRSSSNIQSNKTASESGLHGSPIEIGTERHKPQALPPLENPFDPFDDDLGQQDHQSHTGSIHSTSSRMRRSTTGSFSAQQVQ